MIVQELYLKDYDWSIIVFYGTEDKHRIINELLGNNCPVKELITVWDMLGKKNIGLTFSNPDFQRTVVVIGETTSSEEFQNTFDHEKGHVVMHIAEKFDIDPFSEEFQYLAGTLAEKLFPVARCFLCD